VGLARVLVAAELPQAVGRAPRRPVAEARAAVLLQCLELAQRAGVVAGQVGRLRRDVRDVVAVLDLLAVDRARERQRAAVLALREGAVRLAELAAVAP